MPTSTATKAKAHGVPLQNIFDTLQINLGSLYVNDFNRFGRTYQVIVQADAQFRDDAGRHRAAEDAQRHAARWCRSARCVNGQRDLGPGPRDALQRLSRRRDQRRGRRPATAPARPRPRSRNCSRRRLPNGMTLRVDRPDLPADPRRQHGTGLRLPARACCWCSWCSPRSTKAGACRWR